MPALALSLSLNYSLACPVPGPSLPWSCLFPALPLWNSPNSQCYLPLRPASCPSKSKFYSSWPNGPSFSWGCSWSGRAAILSGPIWPSYLEVEIEFDLFAACFWSDGSIRTLLRASLPPLSIDTQLYGSWISLDFLRFDSFSQLYCFSNAFVKHSLPLPK